MEDNEIYNDNNYGYSKIPFDEEPISRGAVRQAYSSRHRTPSSYEKNSGEHKQGGVFSKNLTIIVAFMFVVNIIFGGLIIRLFILSGMPKVISTNNISITAEDSGAAWAAATKGKLSAVCVGAKYSGDVTYKTFFKMSSNGAGVVLSINKETGDALIVTCYHVVSPDVSKVYVLLIGSYTPIQATVVGHSLVQDIAVLRISGSNEVKESVAEAVEVADSSKLTEGEMAIAIGNPLAGGFSVTSGVISVPYKMVSVENQPEQMRVIQMDAAINPGNSGGGLFNNRGQLIGIVNAKALDSLTSSNKIDSKEAVAFAIPSNLAYSIANNIVRNGGTLMAASVGLTFNSGTSQDSFDSETGKLVQKVTYTVSNTAAASAGAHNGDEIISFSYMFNGETVTVDVVSVYDFDDHKFNIDAGEIVTFNVKRGSVIQTIQIEATWVPVT